MIPDLTIGITLSAREAAEELHDGVTEIRRALDRAKAQRDRVREEREVSIELLTLIGDLSVLLERAAAVSAQATEIAERVSSEAVRGSELVLEREVV